MKWKKWLAVGALLYMARSKNLVVRGIGQAGSIVAAPRLVRAVGRKS